MKRLIVPSLIALALTAFLPGLAQAHRSWLLPSKTQVDGKDQTLTVDASVSDNLFQTDAFALKLDGLSITAPDGSPVQPEDVSTSKQRSSFDLKLSQDGTYRIAVTNDMVNFSYMLGGELKRGRGTSADLAQVPAGATDLNVAHTISRFETWVTANAPSMTQVKPIGQGLEIIPLSNPSDYVVGEKASFRAYLDGKPLSGLIVQIIPGGVRYRGDLQETDVTTDATGEFSITWPMGQMYWIGASYPPRPQEGAGDHDGGKGAGPGAGARPAGEAKGPRGPVQPGTRYAYAGTFEVMPF